MLMCMNLAEWARREPGLLAAAMKKHAAIHRHVAGHRPRGPVSLRKPGQRKLPAQTTP